jgi:hypothetical protein
MNFETSKWTAIVLLTITSMVLIITAESTIWAAVRGTIQSSDAQAIIGRTENGDLVVTSEEYEKYKECLTKNSKEECVNRAETYLLPAQVPQGLPPGQLELKRFKAPDGR